MRRQRVYKQKMPQNMYIKRDERSVVDVIVKEDSKLNI